MKRHHDPLVTKPLQESVVWEREVALKIVVDLLLCFYSIFRIANARMNVGTLTRTQTLLYAHMRAEKCPK